MSFRKEVDKVIQFDGHPSVVRLLGWCLDATASDRVWTVAERLEPFGTFMERPVSWCVLVHSAITVTSLLDLLNDAWSPVHAHGRGWLHCDISPGAFAFSEHAEAKMVDFGGLSYRDTFPVEMAPCTGEQAGECAIGYCLRPWFTRMHFTMNEFRCNKHTQRCNGFDPRAMTRVLCQALLHRLIAPNLLEARGARNATAVTHILEGCMADAREHRSSPTAIGNALREYLHYNDGFKCLAHSNIELEASYYLKHERITSESLRDAPRQRRVLSHEPSLNDLTFHDPYHH